MASSAHDRFPLTENLGLMGPLWFQVRPVFAFPWLQCPPLGGDVDGVCLSRQVEPRRGSSVICIGSNLGPGR
jgi:hypothetical protein